jgi:hypothetical protein
LLKQVVKLVPDDNVAADLLRLITPSDEGAATTSPKLEEPQPAVPKNDLQVLPGTWMAVRGGSKFELALTDESQFTWTLSRKEKREVFSGTWSAEGNLLVLERKDGGSLVGQMTPDGPEKFNFGLLGAPPDDPGLNFSR